MFRLPSPWLAISASSRLLRYGVAAVLAVSAVALDVALHALRGHTFFFLPLTAIMAASLFGGLGPGLLATALAVFGESAFILMPIARGGPNPRGLVAELLFTAFSLGTVAVGAGFRRARAQAERALAELDALLSSSPVGHAFYDRDLCHISVNPALAALLGKHAEEFHGRMVEDMSPELACVITPVLRKVIDHGVAEGPLRFSGELPSGSGRQRRLLASFFPVVLPNGELIGAGGSFVDVTDQSRAEEERLRLLGERDALLGHIPYGVVTVRAPDGEILFHNASAEAIMGRPPKRPDRAEREGPGHFLSENGTPLPAADYPPVRALVTGVAQPAQRLRYARPDGPIRVLEISAGPIRDEVGRVTAAVAVFADVTERVETEEREHLLAEITRLLTASFDYREALRALVTRVVPRLADWCLIDLFDEDGRLERVAIAHRDPERVDQAWTTYQRYRGDIYDSVLGARFLQQSAPLLLPEVDDEMMRQFATDEKHFEALRAFEARSAIGLPLTIRGRFIGSFLLLDAESGRHFSERDLEFLRELSRRIALAVDNAQLFQRAQEAVQARDDFLSMASHDLRTPVTTLRLLMQGLLRRTEGTDGSTLLLSSVRSQLVTGERQTSRIMTMIEDLLDVSRLQAGRLILERRQVDLVSIAREAAARLEPTFASARCPLHIRAPAPVRGEWDASRLDQVITNLLTNAAKYGAGKPIEVFVEVDDGSAVLKVRDYGVGIPPEAQARLFQRFERVGDRTAFHGTGLGLWIVRRVVEAHGGIVTVESNPGEGSVFIVRLPC